MIKIQQEDLQVNQVYYIEYTSGRHSKTPGKIIKMKGICENNDCYHSHWTKFVTYKDVNSSEIYEKDVTTLTYMDFQSSDYPDFLDRITSSFAPDLGVKYYLPQRDIILQRKEIEMVNDVLKFLIREPTFSYY